MNSEDSADNRPDNRLCVNPEEIQLDLPRSRRVLTLSDKVELLSYYNETKCSIRKLAQRFSIGKTQAGLIIKRQQAIYEAWLAGGPNHGRKRLSSTGLQIDKIVYEWYLKRIHENFEVTGPMLQNVALSLAKNMGCEEFKASNGWLAKFMKRHGISFKEKNKDNMKGSPWTKNLSLNYCEWTQRLASVLPDYTADDIFSVSHTGLFFRAVPADTSILNKKNFACGTYSSERFTILLCANMKGIKEKPLVIADISTDELGNLKTIEVDCKSNSKAWLTQDIMNEWLKEMDNRMAEQKKNILLLLDHTLTHHDVSLTNVQIMYFPEFLSSRNHPVNQSIIQNFKIIYRIQLLKHLITVKESDINNSLPSKGNTVNVSDALNWVSSSWQDLNEYVIQKCFEDLCFNTYVNVDKVCDDERTLTLNDVSDLLCAIDSIVNAADYISIDDNLVTTEAEEQIVPIEILVDANELKQTRKQKCAIPHDSVKTFYSETLKGFKELEQFYLSQNDSNGVELLKQLMTHHENVINDKNIDDTNL